ncbi:lipopolysaccharide biosynthesis protein [Lignipirellula cremea]|uniref:MurJ-like flippase n=1 Tax=Lignipirellula cremea TaxID=2528010 RepID=A0A518DMJ3_9BACT|nr:lipopolysaccharide biosynthesis protein [Lignipirellula cremea]QDU93058.1 MurJ-like flippase [Lignipirellula cremea]
MLKMAPQVVPLASNVSPRHRERAPGPSWRGRLLGLLSHSGVAAIFDQGIVSAANFATSVIIGRYGSVDDLGVYFLVLSVLYFARGIQDQIVSGPYTIYAPRRDEAQIPRYTGSVLAHQMLFSAGTVIALLGMWLAMVLGAIQPELTPSLLMLAGVVPFLLLREFIRRLSFARFQVKAVILVDLLVSITQVGALIVFAWDGQISIPAVYLAMGLACAVAAGGWFAMRVQPVVFSAANVLTDWRENWKFGRWALAGQLVGCSAPLVLPWLVAAGHGAAAAGLMAACNTLVGVANTFVLGFCNYLAPKAAQAYVDGGTRDMLRVLLKAVAVFTFCIGGFSLAALVAGDSILVGVYGADYAGGGLIFALYAFAMWANSLKMVAGNGLWAIDRPQVNFIADVASLVVSIIAAVIFVPLWGVFGAALATLTANSLDAMIRFLVLGYSLQRLRPAPLPA